MSRLRTGVNLALTLRESMISLKTQERSALGTSETKSRDHCLSVHTYLTRHVRGP